MIAALLGIAAPAGAAPLSFPSGLAPIPGGLFLAGEPTINVTSTADTVDPSPANGVCELPCTLRAAVQTANGAGSPGTDTIMVPAGLYNRTVGGDDGADPAAAGDLDVTGNLTITGAGQSTTTVDAKSLDRGFDIAPGVTATISGLTITGGLASDGPLRTAGGGIRVGQGPNAGGGGAATLTLDDVTLEANSANAGAGVATQAGGAILTLNRVSVVDNVGVGDFPTGGGVVSYFGGSIAINNSLIRGNTAYHAAGVSQRNAGDITITESTVTENHANAAGHTGGIKQDEAGSLTITRSTVSKNTAGNAGGVYANGGGTTTIVDSTVSENSATTGVSRGGGVIRDSGGTVTIRGSTIAGNVAGAGGGIYTAASTGGTFEISNTTISGNRAMTIGSRPAGTTGRGGGVHGSGGSSGLRLTNVTLRNNLADAGATEIDSCGNPPACTNAPTNITPRNTIVAGAATNCAGPVSSGGHNLDSANSCALTGTGDLVDKDPLLGPLADNGGPTFTHKVLDGSPAIDTGDPATCPALDQRGVLRPQGEACDIGAYEQGLGTRPCSDGIDNDGDGGIDFPADQGCASGADATEAPDAPQCSDRIDNDRDGRTNFPDDQGCAFAEDTSESPDAAQCSDRIDNDGDGRANFPADPGCESAADASESPDPPRTLIFTDPDQPNWEGGYLDSVTVRVVATAVPGNAASETRCVLDPPAAPPSFDALPPACPYLDGAKITAGTHTLYVASRAAGATEAVTSRVFRVVPYPVTKILSGPNGFTHALPTFTFTGLPAGVTFRCRIDSLPFSPCTSPVSYYGLPAGPHTFTVRAVMANGTVDLDPPSRAFTQGVTTRAASCTGLVPFQPSYDYVCTVLDTVCPEGSRCDVETRLTGTAQDGLLATQFAALHRSPLIGPDGKRAGANRADAVASVTCYSDGAPPSLNKCPETDNVTYYGPDPDVRIRCGGAGSLQLGFGEPTRGPDDKRRVTCTSILTIRPVPGLTAGVMGTTVGISLPAAGTLIVAPRATAGQAVAAARRIKKAKRSPFKTVTIKADKAGPVRIPIKLSRSAKALLRRHRRLTLPISLKFTPVGGKKTTRKQGITLTLPPCKPPKRLPKRGRLASCG